ncbi:hypothetical protein PAXRUDRAFT_807414 [Paxillus rubicundulus Ve08.2h10]|uniref:Uncharacterized protein n=1 Tax=Paxillus rubicundulus Ve08.2h10 TaxID=930991 RepID=A0A0D0CFS6_9AGAM|nr:hypothetical protein PAXRUDRAFT_807414 [Paxillus rubicundulus Ve08.2h10]
MKHEYDGDEQRFSHVQHSHVHFVDNLNHVIESKTFRVNYTSYDIHRHQDFMRPGNGCAIMTLSREDGPQAHPFWYAQQIIEVLWVRWLGIQPGYWWGFKEARLPKVGFITDNDKNTFGFLDPSLIIRGCHLIPAFAEGQTDTLLSHGESIARQSGESDDWSSFYVNIYVHTFAGIGVGHQAQYTGPPGTLSGIVGNSEFFADDDNMNNDLHSTSTEENEVTSNNSFPDSDNGDDDNLDGSESLEEGDGYELDDLDRDGNDFGF